MVVADAQAARAVEKSTARPPSTAMRGLLSHFLDGTSQTLIGRRSSHYPPRAADPSRLSTNRSATVLARCCRRLKGSPAAALARIIHERSRFTRIRPAIQRRSRFRHSEAALVTLNR